MKRILIADRDVLFRSALGVLLNSDLGLQVSGEVSDVDDLVASCTATGPDLVLLGANIAHDVSLVSVCRQLLCIQPELAVLAVTDDDDNQQLLLELLEAGAIGYVTRSNRLDDLVHSVDAALRGEACIPRGMLGGLLKTLIARRRQENEALARIDRLSQRERQVLRELAAGHDRDEIAARLFISPQTVRTHVQNVMTKLEVHSRVEAATLARDHGLLDDERGADAT
jgi:two-component system nitrate/nitrite response regulator NarL